MLCKIGEMKGPAGCFYNLLCWSSYIDTGTGDPPAHSVGGESHVQNWAVPAAGGVAANGLTKMSRSCYIDMGAAHFLCNNHSIMVNSS